MDATNETRIEPQWEIDMRKNAPCENRGEDWEKSADGKGTDANGCYTCVKCGMSVSSEAVIAQKRVGGKLLHP